MAVDVVLAREGTLRGETEYTGTTRPTREVALRARTEGRLLSLGADVGDAVRQGQAIGRLDDALLRQAVQQAESELLSRRSEVAGARSRVGDALTQVRQAQLDLTQRQADFRRNIQLYGEGYVPRRDAEAARTAERVAAQVLRSEQQQVKNLQAEVRSAEARVKAQEAVVAQERERLSYANLVSPISGFVTARLTETGNLISAGGEVLRIGDFRWVQVDVQVSELELPQVKVGQTVRLTLDAFPGSTFAGRVDRISPQADPVSRLVPVSITLANPDLKIGAGLLARVRFGSSGPQRVIIPEAALQRSGGARSGGSAGPGPSGERGSASGPGNRDPGAAGGERSDGVETVFVLEEAAQGQAPAAEPGQTPSLSRPEANGPSQPGSTGAEPAFVARSREIRVGDRSDGLAEVVSGLRPGERVVTRSARPLKEGEPVVLSFLSQEALRAGEGETARPRSAAPAPEAPSGPRGSGSPGQGDAGGGFRGAAPSAPRGGGAAGGGGFGGGGGDRPVSLPPIGSSSGTRQRSGGEITGTPGLSRSPSAGGRGSGFGTGQRSGSSPSGAGGFGAGGTGGFGPGGSGGFGTGNGRGPGTGGPGTGTGTGGRF